MFSLFTRIVVTVIGLSFLAFSASSAEVKPENYDIYMGDIDGDGDDDYYFEQSPWYLILHGEIATPIRIQNNFVIHNAGGTYSSPIAFSLTEIDRVARITSGSLKKAQWNYDVFLVNQANGSNTLLIRGAYASSPALLLKTYSGSNLPTVAATYSTALFRNISDRSVALRIADVNGDDINDVILGSFGSTTGEYAYLGDSSHVHGQLLTISAAVPASGGTAVGALAGEFRVDESGAATFSIPISVPDGVAGVKPQLTVNYNSQGGFGLLGIGASISGIGSITRCRQTLLQDGTTRPITWDAGDRFCLNGQRLKVVSGTYGAPGSMYKTEIDSFSLVTAVGGTLGNPDYFELKAKDGSISAYGKTVNAKVSSFISTLTWSLSQFEDSVGNRIDYLYEGDNLTGPRLSSINYAYPTTKSSTNPGARVSFVYEDRTDTTTNFLHTASSAIGGEFYIKQTKRLVAIKTFNTVSSSESLVRRYAFTYTYNSSGQSRLSTATECTGDSESSCYKPTLFTWATAAKGFASSAVWFNRLPSANSFRTHKFMDINGDGSQDLVWVRASGNTRYIEYGYKGTPSGGNLVKVSFSNNVAALAYTNIDHFENDTSIKLESIDYNNDGRADLLVCSKSQATAQNSQCISWDLYVSEPTGYGIWQLSSTKIVMPFKSEFMHFSDMNADGTLEAIELTTNSVKYYSLQRGTNTSSSTYYSFSEAQTIPLNHFTSSAANGSDGYEFYIKDAEFGDVNGDGAMDIVIPAVDTITPVQFYIDRPWKIFIYTHSANQFSYNAQLSFNLGQYVAWPIELQLVDLNQDGLSDLIFKDGLHDNDYFVLNRGAAFSSSNEIRKATFGADDPLTTKINLVDYNQDGFLDVIYQNYSKQRFIYKEWSQTQQTFKPDSELPEERKKTSSFYFADITGDGFSDLVEIKVDSSGGVDIGTYEAFGSSRHNKVHNIQDGMQRVIDIEYGSLANSTHYSTLAGVNTTVLFENCSLNASTSYDPNCNQIPIFTFNKASFYEQINNPFQNINNLPVAPVLELAGPMPVVVAVSSSAPTAQNQYNTNRVAYHYHHARIQAGGRGFLGFEKITTRDEASGVTTQTTYHQDWPFIGLTKKTLVSSPAGHKLSEAENTWNAEIDSFNGMVPRVFLDKTTETSYALKSNGAEQGASLQTVTTDNDYDSYGNATRVEVVTSGAANTSKKITVNTYYPTEWELRMGRLNTSTTTTQRNSDPAVVRSSKFEYFDQFSLWPGMLKKEIIEPGANQQVVEYQYDAVGNKKITQKTANVKPGVSQTRTTEIKYDASGRFAETTYDGLGNVTSGVIERHPVYGLPSKLRDANGVITEVQYNADGTERLRKDASGAWVHTDKAFCGGSVICVSGARYRVVTSVSGGGKTTEYFDILGRTLRTSKVMFDGRESHVDIQYDNLGRVARKSEPYFAGDTVYWTQLHYDLVNRVISTTAPDNTVTTNAYDGYKTTITVDANGKALTRIEERNSLGNLVKVTDHLLGIIAYGYDALGNLTSAATSASGKTVVVRMCYDKMGRKIAMHDPDKGGFLGNANESCTTIENQLDLAPTSKTAGWWFYKYNDFGELIEQTDTKRQVSVMEYDALGRMLKRTDKKADGSVETHTRWYYDTALGASSSTPNTQLKLTAVVSSYNRIDETCAGANYCQTYSYDDISRLTDTVTYLPNSSTGYINSVKYDFIGRASKQYDVLHGLVQTSGVNTRFNSFGYPEQIVDLTSGDVLQKTLKMNARGQVKEELRNNGAAGTTVYTYDDTTGRLTNQTTSLSGALFGIQNVTYAWDKLGNLSSRHNQSGNLSANGSTAKKNLQESFCYDGLNRLIKSHLGTLAGNCNLSVDQQDQEYDGLGNITRKAGMGMYTYSGKGPHAVTSTTNSGSYTYDDNGNQTSGGGRSSIAYSTYDQVIRIVSGTTTTEFAYGPDRARFERRDNKAGIETTTHYLGNVERIQVKGSTVIEWKRYIAGAIYTVRTNTANVPQATDKSFLFNDHLGSLDVVTNAQGKITHSASFDAWGARRSGENWNSEFSAASLSLTGFSAPLTQRGFTGHEMLDDHNLVHMNGRIYDYKLARFLQADPFIQAAADTQSYNRYSYVMNNPLNTTDPSGFFWSKLWKELKPFIGAIVSIAVTFICPVCGPVVAGMIGGAVGAAVNGGNILMGAAFGAFSGLAGGINGIPGFVARGIVGGMQTVMSGGKFGSGFMAAGIGGVGGGTGWTGFVQAAVLGGVASEITGGKFKNGAASAAFMYAVSVGVSKIGVGGIPEDSSVKKVGECSTKSKCQYEDFTPEERAQINASLAEASSEVMKTSWGSADEAAIALHNSDVKRLADALGIEVWARISKDGNIYMVETGFSHNRAHGAIRPGRTDVGEPPIHKGYLKYRDSVWHTHPTGSLVNLDDLNSILERGGAAIYASGVTLSKFENPNFISYQGLSVKFGVTYTGHELINGNWKSFQASW